MDYAAAKTWSHSAPAIDSDEAMAAWETGVAQHFDGTAHDLRAAGARALGVDFARVATGHRSAATAYFSGNTTRVNRANAQLRSVSTRAMNAARGQHATVCVAFIEDFRP
jgi:hypothetical protein